MQSSSVSKIHPFRNPGVGNLLKKEVHRTRTWTVFCPETPRVPHHLTIALNRKNSKGLSGVSEEENSELFALINKIAEIYKTIPIQGFVIAQYDTPQSGHLGRFVVEIIPHLPGFHRLLNIVEKADCNRYVLFRQANITPALYKISKEEALKQTAFWKTAFQKHYPKLTERDTKIPIPFIRQESYQKEAEEMLSRQLTEIKDKNFKFQTRMPRLIPDAINSVTVAKCHFCNDDVIKRQLVYQYENVMVFYNLRQNAKPGAAFLILQKRHSEKVYNLNSSEIRNIGIVRKALTEVLKEKDPKCEVIVYTQDHPTVGQTVVHSHEQLLAVDPKTIAETWMTQSLYPSGNVSDEEMLRARKEFGAKLAQKIKEITALEKTG